MKIDRIYYARDHGDRLLAVRSRRGWNQSELARRADTSSPMVSTLEGKIGRRVSEAIAQRIAEALGEPLESLFSDEAPPAELVGRRSRPATPAADRYDGTVATAEAKEWTDYLDRARDTGIYDYGRPLSLVRAAERFRLGPHTLSKAAKTGRVRTTIVPRPGGGRNGEVFEFDEAQLAADLAALPLCSFPGCEARALGPSGGCSEHARRIAWTGQRHSCKAREKMAAANRGRPRPDAAERMERRHAEVAGAIEDLQGTPAWAEWLTTTQVAERLGTTARRVTTDLVYRGRLVPKRWTIKGRTRVLFRAADVQALELLPRGEHGRRQWEAGEGPFVDGALHRSGVSPRGRQRAYGRISGRRGAAAGIEGGRLGGRPPEATPEEEATMANLLRAGRSYRDIAAEVFGDQKYKNRVQRFAKR